MQIFNLDLSKKTDVPALHAKQGDKGRKIQLVITDGGENFPIPNGAAFSIWYSGTGGTGNYTAVDGHSAFCVSGNIVTVELSPAMLCCKGGGLMSLAIHGADGAQLGLWDILYFVEALPGADSAQAQPYYDAFSEVVAHALEASHKAQEAADKLQPDSSLSAAGKPAEAAAVGAALAGKAPAGFGLGESADAVNFDKLDETRLTGWYRVYNLPEGFVGSSNYAYLRVDGFIDPSGDVPHVTQTLYVVNPSNTILRRADYNKTGWEAWQYVRPKMTIGVEYLTPYLWCGLPVYTKIFKVTYPTADEGLKLRITLPDNAYPITAFGRDKSRMLPYGTLGTRYIGIKGGAGYLEIETAGTYGGASGKPTICVFYTKQWEA